MSLRSLFLDSSVTWELAQKKLIWASDLGYYGF